MSQAAEVIDGQTAAAETAETEPGVLVGTVDTTEVAGENTEAGIHDNQPGEDVVPAAAEDQAVEEHVPETNQEATEPTAEPATEAEPAAEQEQSPTDTPETADEPAADADAVNESEAETDHTPEAAPAESEPAEDKAPETVDDTSETEDKAQPEEASPAQDTAEDKDAPSETTDKSDESDTPEVDAEDKTPDESAEPAVVEEKDEATEPADNQAESDQPPLNEDPTSEADANSVAPNAAQPEATDTTDEPADADAPASPSGQDAPLLEEAMETNEPQLETPIPTPIRRHQPQQMPPVQPVPDARSTDETRNAKIDAEADDEASEAEEARTQDKIAHGGGIEKMTPEELKELDLKESSEIYRMRLNELRREETDAEIAEALAAMDRPRVNFREGHLDARGVLAGVGNTAGVIFGNPIAFAGAAVTRFKDVEAKPVGEGRVELTFKTGFFGKTGRIVVDAESPEQAKEMLTKSGNFLTKVQAVKSSL
jgi:hypothetical protein